MIFYKLTIIAAVLRSQLMGKPLRANITMVLKPTIIAAVFLSQIMRKPFLYPLSNFFKN